MLTDRALSELEQLLSELDALLAKSGGELSAHAGGTLAMWRAKLKSAQERFSRLHVQARQRAGEAAEAGEQALRENPWRSVAVAATAGLLLGLALGARDRSVP
jgi:ElaB/YqjD/DUF883 family membrane-anchored ribosome-binding protein